jgi:hypothetical protein
VATAAQQSTGREMCRQFLGWSTRLEIAITIRKSNHTIGIRDVQKLRVLAQRIKGDPERFVQIAFCKCFSDIRFVIAVSIAQHLYLIGATLYNEDVAIRCAEQESRIAKSAGVQFDFESRRNFGLHTGWPIHNVRPINCESIRAWRRQILNHDFAHDAGRIARPIAHCSFAGEDRAFFRGRTVYDSERENRREKDNTKNYITRLASFHVSGIVRAPNIARIRIICR